MSGNGLKRSSKWDLKEEPQIPYEGMKHGGDRSKWSSTESMPGGRGSHRNDGIDEHRSRSGKMKMAWDGDENYGTRMSPGLDEWRQHRRHSPSHPGRRARRSPGWSRSRSNSRSRSRSRSRSPVHGFKRESGSYETMNNKSRTSAPICRNFAAGTCRRGNHCQFLHQDGQAYDAGWERQKNLVDSKHSPPRDYREYPGGNGRSADICVNFLRGDCRRGSSCRFKHQATPDDSGLGSSTDITRDRDSDRRHRGYASPERHDRGYQRAADVPCRYFAAGNCRNGKYCRFSHDQVRADPEERSQESRSFHRQRFDDAERWGNEPKWSNTNVSDAANPSDLKNEKLDIPEAKMNTWSPDDRKACIGQSVHQEVVGGNRKEAHQWQTENPVRDMHVTPRSALEEWPGEMEMSPDWHPPVKSSNYSNHPDNRNQRDNASLPTGAPIISHQLPDRLSNAAAVVPAVVNEVHSVRQDNQLGPVSTNHVPHEYRSSKGTTAGFPIDVQTSFTAAESFNFNGPSQSALPLASLNVTGQSQLAIPADPSRGTNVAKNPIQTNFHQENVAIMPNSVSVNASQVNPGTLTQSIVSREQLTQLTTISASLAQLLANGHQLPQLLAAHQPDTVSAFPSNANSEGPVKPVSDIAMQQNQAIGHQKQYDSINNSIELKSHNIDNSLLDALSSLPGQKQNTDVKLETGSNSMNTSLPVTANDDRRNGLHISEEPTNKSNHLNQSKQKKTSEVTKENKPGTKESVEVKENKSAEDNEPLENAEGDGKTDENKKGKDGKVLRAFKFALVEFVKELLKPKWKEGQMSKDLYKNIVKKVVDKVTGTMQAASIPQTQEKIEQYLSASKPKLTKLVQAYIDKLQKDK